MYIIYIYIYGNHEKAFLLKTFRRKSSTAAFTILMPI